MTSTEQTAPDRIERELARHAKSIRRTQQAFALFAIMALLLALGNLVTTAAKLGTKDVRVTPTRAAARASRTAAPAAPVRSLSVGLKEFKVLPSVARAAAGKVTFHVHNAGTVKHEFVVIRTDKPAASLLKGSSASEKGKVGEIPGLNPGKSGSLSLHLAAGHYALICNQPGHYKAGQHTDFTVQ
jgi:uncharacterized cupredoxin-like copper-binding protein